MKTRLINIFGILLLMTSCNFNKKENATDSNYVKKTQPYEIETEDTLSFGSENYIRFIRPLKNRRFQIIVESLIFVESTMKNVVNEVNLSLKGEIISIAKSTYSSYVEIINLDNFKYKVETKPDDTLISTQENVIYKESVYFGFNYLSKYDNQNKLVWTKKIDVGQHEDNNYFLRPFSNNSLVFVSNQKKIRNTEKREKGISLLLYSAEGEIESEVFIKNPDEPNPISLDKLLDNNYLLTATTYSYSEKNLWIFKLTENGDTLWSKTYLNFNPNETKVLNDSCIIFFGNSWYNSKFGPCSYMKIIKVDKNGSLLWNKDIRKNFFEETGNVIELDNGNYLFSSCIEPTMNKGSYAYIFELDKEGNIVFEKRFDFSLGQGNIPYIIKGENEIIMISIKKVGNFKNVLSIAKLKQ